MGLLGIITPYIVIVMYSKLQQHRIYFYGFGTSVFIFMLCLVGSGLVTFREDDVVASQRLSYPGSVHFPTLRCFGTSLFLLTKHADLLFVIGQEVVEPDDDEEAEAYSEDDMQDDQVQVIPKEGILG